MAVRHIIAIAVILAAVIEQGAQAELKTYKIEVKTTDKLWAGTDDTVKINLKGTKGSSEFRKLDNSWKNDFERGSTSKFELEMADLGVLKSVELKKNGRDDWRANSVKVIDEKTEAIADFGDMEVGKTVVSKPFISG